MVHPHTTYPHLDPRSEEVPEAVLERLATFADRWQGKIGNEQQLSQSFLIELCEALGTARPTDSGTVPAYEFEHRVELRYSDKSGEIDLYKPGHFLLEAKCGRNRSDEPGSAPVRGTRPWHRYIERAYEEQARVYAGALDEAPPLLIVVDIGHRFWIWRRKEGGYAAFGSPETVSFELSQLADEPNARVLLAAFEDPSILDVHRFQARVTEEVAERLAPLAKRLQERTDEPRAVASFLIRCLFCMFAEDVDLLPRGHFTKLLKTALDKSADLFKPHAERLFTAMRDGGEYDWERIGQFNGALFEHTEAFDLDRDDLTILADAAALNWANVEPAIFGTLIERALDPRERQRLGAHYTPREFVERLVRPTIEEPLRFQWNTIRTRVDELLQEAEAADDGTERKKRETEALDLVDGFRQELTQLHILDPACGTGNFLYVSYAVLRELEYEVLEARHRIEGLSEALAFKGGMVVAAQFHGIEIESFASEIAQLVLWIGHLQWELRHRKYAQIEEPIIPAQRSIECGDALITWKTRAARVGDDGEAATRWDWRTYIQADTHEGQIPDPDAQVPIYDYQGVEHAEWPGADFVVGNPPFIGNKMMRDRLGDGYVEALREAYDDVPDSVDFVMYWWHKAAVLAREGRIRRFGFITTDSIKQIQNRQVLTKHLGAKRKPLRLTLAIPDHPWVDGEAQVRISMTAAERDRGATSDQPLFAELVGEEDGVELHRQGVPAIHPDLKIGVDVTQAVPLLANEDVSFQGMNLVGKGFRLSRQQVRELGYDPENLPPIIKPYLNAREMMQGRKDRFVIDAYGLTAGELKKRYPPCYQWLLDRVKREREQNNRRSYRENWWLFGEARGALRRAVSPLTRFLITPETSRYRVFAWLRPGTIPDHKLYVIALEEDYHFGVCQSRIQRVWSLYSGGRMGVGNDPTFNNTRCFLPFPFPDPTREQRHAIVDAIGRLHAFREDARARADDLTFTNMYKLIRFRREGRKLTGVYVERHARLATDTLIELHEALDAAVARAYGWEPGLDDQALLAWLVELNQTRAEEEANGHIRWLRPDRATEVDTDAEAQQKFRERSASTKRPKWPKDRTDRVARVLSTVLHAQKPLDVEGVASQFKRARRKQVAAILDRLADMNLIVETQDDHYARAE